MKSWVKDKKYAIEIEEEKKRIIENALAKLREEKEERIKRAQVYQRNRANQVRQRDVVPKNR